MGTSSEERQVKKKKKEGQFYEGLDFFLWISTSMHRRKLTWLRTGKRGLWNVVLPRFVVGFEHCF